ncbi:MAG: hypothetical protein FD145_893 [Candidatus Saganbacteria bacterium]|uniref:Type 4 fimbrial biogenesis protein PilX N-terminal domain-containing protein n=1 Tax=Candidatus Saganbacteria bacterium TaxID=2575572 RepID=A0A833L0Y9_UNCSA|nr:MAG: hypothetical protein FD145_893 [Candidatus Saganbacteria bacterium]
MNRGFVLVAAIFVVITFAVLGVVIVSLMSGENILSLRDYNSIRAFQIAEAGLNYTVAYSLANDSDWSDNSGFTKNFGGGSFTISYSDLARKSCVLKSTGTFNGISRSITFGLKKSGIADAFSYAMYCNNLSTETLVIENSATVYGDFYYDGPVVMKNSSKLVNGTMFSDSLSLQNSATCASWETITQVDPPTFDSSYYDNLLKETTKSATSALNLSGSSILNLDDFHGVPQYYTSITLSNSAKIIGSGTLVATTGNFQLNNSSQIGDEITVIVKGTTSFNNSSKVGVNFELISGGSVTVNNSQNVPGDGVFFSDGNIVFNNSAQFKGSVLAPHGKISSVNSTIFKGLLYGREISLENSTTLSGSAAVNEVGYFRNSAVVTYDPAQFPAVFPQGLEGGGGSGSETTSLDWRESF